MRTHFFTQSEIDEIIRTIIAKPSFGGNSDWARARLALGLRVGDTSHGGQIEYLGGDNWAKIEGGKIVAEMTMPKEAKMQAAVHIAMAAARCGTGVPDDVIVKNK